MTKLFFFQQCHRTRRSQINKTPISKATIDACPNLKCIAVLATGYNVVDYVYAKEKDIPVLNVPTYGTQIVGQYALDMEVLAYDTFQSEAGKALAEYVDLDTLLAKSDVIFLHCPLFPETEGIINKDNPLLLAKNCIITPHISWAGYLVIA